MSSILVLELIIVIVGYPTILLWILKNEMSVFRQILNNLWLSHPDFMECLVTIVLETEIQEKKKKSALE